MTTKTSYNQPFHKNDIFNKKGIFDANYLLPAGQHMNNFQHILHNLYLLYKNTNDSFKDSRLELPWQQLQEMSQKFLPYGQKIWQILRFTQGKMWNRNLSGWYEFSFDYIYYLLFLDDHISCIYNLSKLCSVLSFFLLVAMVTKKKEFGLKWPKNVKRPFCTFTYPITHQYWIWSLYAETL